MMDGVVLIGAPRGPWDEARTLVADVPVPGRVRLFWVEALGGWRIEMWWRVLMHDGEPLLVKPAGIERAAWERAFVETVLKVFGCVAFGQTETQGE